MNPSALTAWLDDIASEGVVPDECEAIYLGIFEGAADEFVVHFLGSASFDANDSDWACEKDGDWLPQHRYLHLGVPTSHGAEVFERELITAAREVLATGESILSSVRNVAVGFDDGDLTRLTAE